MRLWPRLTMLSRKWGKLTEAGGKFQEDPEMRYKIYSIDSWTASARRIARRIGAARGVAQPAEKGHHERSTIGLPG